MTDPRASTAERLYCCGSGARPGSLDSPSALAVRISPFLCTVAVFRHTRLTIVDPSAVLVDLSSYSLAVPVIPFRLQALGYGDIGGKTGWLVSASRVPSSLSSVRSTRIDRSRSSSVSSSWQAQWYSSWRPSRMVRPGSFLHAAGEACINRHASLAALMVVARILQGFSGTVLWTIGL